MPKRIRHGSALAHVLEGLLPFTEENIYLTFKPSAFYKKLSQDSGKAKSSLKNAMSLAKREKLIEQNKDKILFSKEAKALMERFKKLEATPLRSGYMLVLFDIPQSHDAQRRLFARELKSLRFKRIQRSVWASEYDNRDIVLEIIAELKIGKFVAISLTHPVFGSPHFE